MSSKQQQQLSGESPVEDLDIPTTLRVVMPGSNQNLSSPVDKSVVEQRTEQPVPVVEMQVATKITYKPCRCKGTCACQNPMVFPQRIASLPAIKAFFSFYEKIKDVHPVLNCMFTTIEVTSMVSAIPANLVARMLRQTLKTPVYVADLVLCKGLDVAERALPCLSQSPNKTLRDLAFCACGVPAGACYMATKLTSRAVRTCLCDIPAVVCGIPAVIGSSLAEICLCDIPQATCYQTAMIAAKAAHGTLNDFQAVLKDMNFAANQISGQISPKTRGCRRISS